jgi:hypothetical protein
VTDLVEMVAGEENDKYRRAGLVLKTLGWLGICWAAMISIWIWMGLRAGSNWWLWGAIGLFVGGAILIGIGSRLQAKAVHLMTKPPVPGNDVRAA